MPETRPYRKYKQLNDVKSDDLAMSLEALNFEGYPEWTLIPDKRRTVKTVMPDGQHVMYEEVIETYIIVGWHEDEEHEHA
jgi:hypothetical protein